MCAVRDQRGRVDSLFQGHEHVTKESPELAGGTCRHQAIDTLAQRLRIVVHTFEEIESTDRKPERLRQRSHDLGSGIDASGLDVADVFIPFPNTSSQLVLLQVPGFAQRGEALSKKSF